MTTTPRLAALAVLLTLLLATPPPLGANALSGSPDVQLEANQHRAEMGTAIAAGDFDGDGLDDLLVGVHLFDGGQEDEGAVFLFLSPILSSDPLSAAARFEGDQPGAFFGSSLAAADVDGDGHLDAIVGAPGYGDGQSAEGAVFVFLGTEDGLVSGSTATADTVLQSNQAGAEFGTSVAVGDFDGDGFDDVIAGAPFFTNGLDNLKEGIALLFHGSAAGIADGDPMTAATLLQADQSNADFGIAVAAADVDGDGFDEAIVGADAFDAPLLNEGAVFVFPGSAAGVLDANPLGAATQIRGDQERAALGGSVASPGDVDGDGRDDLLVGAVTYDNPENAEGAALLFLGSASGIPDGSPATAHAFFESNIEGGRMGASVAGAGDVDGDGFLDLVLGTPSNNSSAAARAYLFLGSADGFTGGDPSTADAALSTLALQPFSGLGTAVAPAGDVNGDGFDDVAVGAPFFELDTLDVGDEGAVLLYYGAAAAPANSPPVPGTDDYAMETGQMLSVPLGPTSILINDFDPEGDPVAASLVTSTANGVLSFTGGSGAFTYVPDDGFAGVDFFTYRLMDAAGSTSQPAVVSIRVEALLVFADGFESGDTSAWTTSVP